MFAAELRRPGACSEIHGVSGPGSGVPGEKGAFYWNTISGICGGSGRVNGALSRSCGITLADVSLYPAPVAGALRY